MNRPSSGLKCNCVGSIAYGAVKHSVADVYSDGLRLQPWGLTTCRHVPDGTI